MLLFLLLNVSFAVQASELPPSILLDWEEKDADAYEIVILEDNKKIIVDRKIVKAPPYNLTVTSPGTYYWKVRYRYKTKWSNFSELGLINIRDELNQLKQPLMIYPKDGAEILFKKETLKEITFVWKERPGKRHQYVLEIYKSKDGGVTKAFKRTGSSATIRIPRGWNDIWWRVRAESLHGNQTTNMERFHFRITYPDKEVIKIQVPPKEEKRNRLWSIDSSIGKTASAYTLKSVASEEESIDEKFNLQGASVFLRGSWWPGFMSPKESFSGGFRLYSLSEEDQTLNQKEYSIDYGRVLYQSATTEHKLSLGAYYVTSAMNMYDISYTVLLASLRYDLLYKITEKISFEFSSQVMQSASFNPFFRMRPSFQYKLTEIFAVNAFAEYEQQNFKLMPVGYSTLVDIGLKNTMYGLGLTWSK